MEHKDKKPLFTNEVRLDGDVIRVIAYFLNSKKKWTVSELECLTIDDMKELAGVKPKYENGGKL